MRSASDAVAALALHVRQVGPELEHLVDLAERRAEHHLDAACWPKRDHSPSRKSP
jgi:hypothetical protein